MFVLFLIRKLDTARVLHSRVTGLYVVSDMQANYSDGQNPNRSTKSLITG